MQSVARFAAQGIPCWGFYLRYTNYVIIRGVRLYWMPWDPRCLDICERRNSCAGNTTRNYGTWQLAQYHCQHTILSCFKLLLPQPANGSKQNCLSSTACLPCTEVRKYCYAWGNFDSRNLISNAIPVQQFQRLLKSFARRSTLPSTIHTLIHCLARSKGINTDSTDSFPFRCCCKDLKTLVKEGASRSALALLKSTLRQCLHLLLFGVYSNKS